ncbi:MAG: hypothetical protein LC721_11555, partial [Actinobacteria bacterium]|nr:hypothetical protein [Actinomycetota bacterium]
MPNHSALPGNRLHRGDGQTADPGHVDHIGNDIVTTWAPELFAHSSEHGSSPPYRCAVDGPCIRWA